LPKNGPRYGAGAYDNRSFRWTNISERVRLSARILVLVATVPAVLVAAPRPDGLEDLAARFRAYRVELRRDTARERAELRDWNGPVHAVMADVGRRLEDRHCRVGEVYRLIGPPDETIRAGGRHNGTPVAPGESHLVYWWRGGHDYLYLIVRRGRVARSCWWYAYE